MTKTPVKKYQLCAEKLETLEDVKKILSALQIRIDTDDPLYEELKYYFTTEVVPRGYLLVLEKLGYEGIANMTWDEMAQMGSELLNQNEE